MESDSNAREDIAVLIVLALDSRSARLFLNVRGCIGFRSWILGHFPFKYVWLNLS